jgi:hypothetical protein
MRYQRGQITWRQMGSQTLTFVIDWWQDCPDTDIPHTVIEAFKHFPNEPVLIAGWAYRVID